MLFRTAPFLHTDYFDAAAHIVEQSFCILGKGRDPMDIRKQPPHIRYDLRRGLTESAAEDARRTFGQNVLTKKKRPGFFRQFLANFNDPIIKILLGALAINVAVTIRQVNFVECGGIAAAILIATLVSTVSEYSSAKAFDSLNDQAADTEIPVRRDGVWRRIRISETLLSRSINVWIRWCKKFCTRRKSACRVVTKTRLQTYFRACGVVWVSACTAPMRVFTAVSATKAVPNTQ